MNASRSGNAVPLRAPSLSPIIAANGERTMFWVSIILAISVPAIIVSALFTRGEKGIGWQFIRFVVIATSIPIVGLLALNNVLTGEAATVLGIAMAYAFGKSAE